MNTPTRGFVTIATGARRYYELADNLLYSYRHYSQAPLPFAIIADQENDITVHFDQTVILEHPAKSFMDKLCLFDYLPFDETIFIDADCLAYRDLNGWFEDFSSMGDFSCFGYAYCDLNTRRGWFNLSAVSQYRDQIFLFQILTAEFIIFANRNSKSRV